MSVVNPVLARMEKSHHGTAGQKAEKLIAKRLRGKLQTGSGAMDHAKGDVKLDGQVEFLIENKTTQGKSFSVQKEHCLKIHKEALAVNRVPALAFQFVDELGKSEKRERWVAISEALFMETFGPDALSK